MLEDLATATRTNVRLGVLDGREVAYLEKLTGVPAMQVGRATVPAHATALGKALLAFSPADTVDAVIAHGLDRFTPSTLTTSRELRRALGVIRLTRVAVCRREYDARVSAVAVPVFGCGGAVVAALEAAVRDRHGNLHLMQPALTVAALTLSRDLATRSGDDLRIRPRPTLQALTS